ncbi:type III-B CRISPR module RAMP protein Cmr1 [Phaeodactylibacter luteus]|uniref:Type III-B CRISPR module RAMP protein Cmr1 n=1 Tax=Phaeodactylibacter luteus TaxID=1564516 RepID=A0A5C6RN16_9BACT|nr:type III-B CRISPR module RAMP protein Cmr1 [Phaeodactylibacter luteus]TXB63741.1 type III-B CRISPR module RAMP protein Cmr1 [Phaeodactylibacter luteus]
MNKITFHCRTISPMFLSGPDTDEAELRAPSIKGALRFWARAISLGWPYDKQGDESHKRLLKQDESLFGGVTEAHGRSLVELSVRCGEIAQYPATLLHLDEGGKYLFYSLVAKGYQVERKYIAEDFPFAVVLRSKEEGALRKAAAAFWVLAHFGALGTRARRGAGAFRVVKTDGDALPEALRFKPNAELGAFLKKSIAVVHDIFQVSEDSLRSENYSTLGNAYLSSEAFPSWDKALDAIGSIMLKHRKAIPNKDRSRRKFTMETLNQKAAFGLPISVRDDNSVNFQETENEKYSRRASPVSITLLKHKNQFHWMVTKLEGRLIPEGVGFEFHSKNPKATCEKDHFWTEAELALLNSFFEKLKLKSVPIKTLIR